VRVCVRACMCVHVHVCVCVLSLRRRAYCLQVKGVLAARKDEIVETRYRTNTGTLLGG
jgi:hypothetical protein